MASGERGTSVSANSDGSTNLRHPPRGVLIPGLHYPPSIVLVLNGHDLTVCCISISFRSELVEKHRVMRQRKLFSLIRKGLYVILTLVLITSLVLDCVNVVYRANDLSNKTIVLFSSFIFGIFSVLVVTLAFIALIRSARWWSVRLDNNINSFIRYKTFTFMAATIIVIFVTASLFWRAVRLFVGVRLSPTLFFCTR